MSPDIFAVSDGDINRFKTPTKLSEEWSEDVEPECINGSVCHNGRVSICRVNNKVFFDTQKIHKDMLDYCIDCDRINGKVQVGSRRAGDKLTLAKRGCTKSLKNFSMRHMSRRRAAAMSQCCATSRVCCGLRDSVRTDDAASEKTLKMCL